MKRKFLLVFIAIVCVICCAVAVFMLGGCTADGNGGTPNQNQQSGSETPDGGSESTPPAHTHQFSDKWTSDEVNHWHAATCGHTDKKDEAAHTYVNGVCKICDHAHVNHDFGSWVEDTPASETATGSRHKDCFCGYRVTEEIPKIVGFEFKQSGNGYAVIAYTGSLTELTVPAEHDGKPVTIIDENAFYDGAFTSIKLPATIKEIGKKAFGYCTQLKNIEIPNCARFGDSAFEGCAALQEITLPEDAISLGTTLFKYCSALQKVTVKGGTVQATTFSGAGAVEEIILEERVTSVGTYAFRDCKNLQKLTMPRVDTSETFMFNYFYEHKTSSSHLKLLTITNQQISVYNKVFEDCTCEIDIWVKFPITKISVVGASEYYIDTFSEENYKLRVEYEDGFKEDFPLFGYISQEDQAAFRTAGSHEITATYQNKTCTAAISVLLHQFDEAALENAEYIFDGLPHSLSVTGVPEETEIVYTGNEQSEVGEHTVTAYLTKQYYEPKTLTATLNILKQQYDIFYVLGLDGVTNDNPANYETNGRNVTLQNPARLGWEFAGWYTESSFSNKITVIKGNAHVDYILYAKWWSVFTLSDGAITGLTSYGKQQTELIIDETINGTKITSIADKAFYQNANLQKITLPSSITSIGNDAFYKCTSLTGVYITDLVAWCNIEFGGSTANPLYYANNLYLNNKPVTAITAEMLQGVTEIKSYAFCGFTSLTSITIPDGATSISERAFYNCTSLESVTFGNNSKLKTIGRSAFYGCKNLESITIPVGVTYIGYEAFYYCDSLTSITIPDGVTSIGEWAFFYCTSLESVNFGNNSKLETIGSNAFGGCTSLTGVYITDLVAWCNIAFGGYNANPLYYARNLYLNNKPVTAITAEMLQGITKIKSYAFEYCKSLTSITIPNSVISIGSLAFDNCTSLTSITIPNSVTSISEGAFYHCTAEIKWGDNPTIKKIDSAFRGYKGASITIPNSVTSIGNRAFNDCTSLKSITIPDGVTSISEGAFSGCTSLESMTLPFVGGSIRTANDTYQYPFGYIFGRTSYSEASAVQQHYYGISTSSTTFHTYYIPYSLKNVTITGGNILYGAFYNCTSLTSITITNGVTSIGERAFWGCTSLKSITIPDSVTSIGSGAFYDCTRLTGVYITDLAAWCNIAFGSSGANPLYYAHNLYLNNKPVAEITAEMLQDFTEIKDYVFAGFGGTSITIPAGVTSIGSGAFYGCTRLTSITIPDGVTSIGRNAFSGCTCLTSITIPDGVTSIGKYAFDGCTSLVTVYYGGDSTQWNGISIDDYNSNLKNATRYYFSENAPDTAKWAESENWWHYDPVTGEIAIWKKD